MVSDFIAACEQAGVTADAVIKSAGIHRGVWHRWKTGAFSPNLRNWSAVQTALERMTEGRAG
jgi:chitinase